MDPLCDASLDLSWECLGKLIFSLFAVDPLSGASLDLFPECLGEQMLSLFAVDPLSGASLDLSSESLDKADLNANFGGSAFCCLFGPILGMSW